MVNSRLWRTIVSLLRVLAMLVDEFVTPENPVLAVAEDLLGPFLEGLGLGEPILFDVLRLLEECLNRMREAERRGFRATFVRPDLLWPGDSPAKHILAQRNDAGYMQLVRVDVRTFDWIEAAVAAVSPGWVAHRNDPARGFNLDARHCIAAALAWMGSTCIQSWLQQAFGNTRSPMSRDLSEGLHHVLAALRVAPEAAIRWPSPDDMEWFFELICQARDGKPPIQNCRVFGWIDGIRSRIQQPGLVAEQREFYNRWVRDTSVVSLFAFSPLGTIIYASLNHPGRTNDAAIAASVFFKLLDPDSTPADMGLLGDSAFCSPRLLFKMWTRTRPSNWPDGHSTNAQWRAFVKWLTASRQAVEWGMRALRSRWARLNVPMPADSEQRRMILELAARLHNVVARLMGANQIRSVYLEAALRHAEGFDAFDIAEDFGDD